MNNFFNPDNALWNFFSKLADYFILSLLWLLCSIPLITVGTATIALYDSIAHCVRGTEGGPCKRFFRTFKAELLRGMGITLLWALIGYLLGVGYQILSQMAEESRFATVYAMVYSVTMFIPVGILCWLIPIESRFTYSFRDLHKTALLISIGRLPSTLALVALLVVSIVVTVILPFMVMLLPGMVAMLQSWFIERVFRQYMPDEKTEEETKEIQADADTPV